MSARSSTFVCHITCLSFSLALDSIGVMTLTPMVMSDYSCIISSIALGVDDSESGVVDHHALRVDHERLGRGASSPRAAPAKLGRLALRTHSYRRPTRRYRLAAEKNTVR